MKTTTFPLAPALNYIRYTTLVVIMLIGINTNGQNIYSILYETWVNPNWQNSYQTLNTYDGSNYLTHSHTNEWIMPPGMWQNYFRTDYFNNPDGTVNHSLTQNWDTGTNTWSDISRSTYTYNAFKKVVTRVTEIYISGWQNSSKETNSYDANGYLTNSLIQSWDFLLNNWKNFRKTDFFNNPSGTVNHSLTQVWNASNIWVDSERTTYTYTATNKVHTTLTELWTNIWENYRLSTYFYNASDNLSQIVSQLPDDGIWVNESRVTYGYTLGTADFAMGKKITVYPNPSTDMITINTTEPFLDTNYFITDQTGRIIKKGQLNDQETIIDISQMSNGLYFFRIDDNYKNSIKLIKN